MDLIFTFYIILYFTRKKDDECFILKVSAHGGEDDKSRSTRDDKYSVDGNGLDMDTSDIGTAFIVKV